jgi:hypothetical protein
VYLSGTNQLVPAKSSVQSGTASFAAAPGAAGTGGSAVETPSVTDPPGTAASYNTAPLAQDFDLVGIPKLTVHIDAPSFAQSQAADPATHLVVFAKLLDVDADGNATLPQNLLSAVRVADVTKPVEIELPGIAHRFAKGHVMRLVVATSNATNHGNNFAGPVSITADKVAASTLTLPKLGAQTGTTPSGMAVFQSPKGAPPSQKAGKGAKARGLRAATMTTNRSCITRRRGLLTRVIRRGGRNRAVSAAIFVNGKRVKTLRGRNLRSFIRIRTLPRRGAFRLLVTVKTTGGRTLGAARTYRVCG